MMASPSIQKLRPLSNGALIGLVSAGGPSSKERYELGVKELERRGFRVIAPLDPTEFYARYDHGFASGSIARRTSALMELVENPEVELLLSVRGAYGSLDILPNLDFEKIKRAGKTLVALSDITALLVNFLRLAQIPSIHGPSLASAFADSATSSDDRESVDRLLQMLQDPSYRPEHALQVVREGSGRGPILAGNLTMFQCLLGTPWDIDYSGHILVLEEVGESPYRIHRAFTQLKLAGKLNKLSGLVIGRFARCETKQGPAVEDVLQMLKDEMLRDTNFPILKGLEMGHWGKNLPMPLGCQAEISGNTLRLLESPLGAV